MSQLKIKDGNSWIEIPAGGVGVPSGGNAGDVLIKSSSTDYATEWADISIPAIIVKYYNYQGQGNNYWAVDAMKALFGTIPDAHAFICDLLITGNNSSANGRYTAMGYRYDSNNGNIEIIGRSVSGNVQKIVGLVSGTWYE